MRLMSNETERCDLSYPRIGSMNIVNAMPVIFFGHGNPGHAWQRSAWTESRRNFTDGLVLILTALLSPFAVAGQTQPYTVRTGDYVLDLPSAQWRAITISVADYARDFTFTEDKGSVRLRIRREIVKYEDVSTTYVAERQRRLDRSARRGYVTRTIENFKGALSGTKYSYEYVTAGKPMARVIYYLRATKRRIYRVEFIGSPKMLLDLADQTESIARSFRLQQKSPDILHRSR